MGKILERIENFDYWMISNVRRWAMPFARFSIFIVYFWSGILKLLSLSPLNPIISELITKTIPGVPLNNLLIVLGVFEIIIALTIINHSLRHLALFFLTLHLIVVILPLFLLPEFTWSGFLIPTLEGRFIIDNILTIALMIVILAHLHPLVYKEKNKLEKIA